MGIKLDPIIVINTALCVAIFVLGYLGYKEEKSTMSLFIGIAFALFGISHIVTLFGFGESLMNILVTIRVIAYLIVVGTLYKLAFRR